MLHMPAKQSAFASVGNRHVRHALRQLRSDFCTLLCARVVFVPFAHAAA
jgi:hypothetical protein